MTRLRSALETIVFARPVPFDGADGGVDHDGPAANVGAVFDAGGRAFLAGGNTGEYYSLADLGWTDREQPETHYERLESWTPFRL